MIQRWVIQRYVERQGEFLYVLSIREPGIQWPNVLQALESAAGSFDTAFARISGGWIGIVCSPIALLLFPLILRWIGRGEEEGAIGRARFLKWALGIGAVLGSVSLIMSINWIFLMADSGGEPFSSGSRPSLLWLHSLFGTWAPALSELVMGSVEFIFLFRLLRCRLHGQPFTGNEFRKDLITCFTPVFIAFGIMIVFWRIDAWVGMFPYLIGLSGPEWEGMSEAISRTMMVVSPVMKALGFLMIPVPFIIVLESVGLPQAVECTLRLYRRCTSESIGFMVAMVLYSGLVAWLMNPWGEGLTLIWRFDLASFWSWTYREIFFIAMSALEVIALTGILWATRERWIESAPAPSSES